MKILGLFLAVTIYATAYWTGRVEYVSTVTGQRGVRCEYSYAGNKFWATFVRSTCPNSIEVR